MDMDNFGHLMYIPCHHENSTSLLRLNVGAMTCQEVYKSPFKILNISGQVCLPEAKKPTTFNLPITISVKQLSNDSAAVPKKSEESPQEV